MDNGPDPIKPDEISTLKLPFFVSPFLELEMSLLLINSQLRTVIAFDADKNKVFYRYELYKFNI